MSLITEQIKRLKELSMADMSFYKDEDYRKACKEAADTISVLSEKLQAANMERSTAYYNGGWIPVSEKLPEDSDEYLVTVIDEDDETYTHTGIAWYAHPKDYDVEKGDWRELMINETVIAWMPLPAPYEPHKSEEQE